MFVQNLIIALVHGVGLLAILAISFGMVERLDWSRTARSIVHGLFFGGGAVFAMLAPAQVADGVLFDARAIIVGFAAAFGGWPAALVAAAIAAAFRTWLGGVGVVPGVIGIVTAGLLGLGWRRFLRPKTRLRPHHLLGLGLTLSCYLPTGMVLGYVTWVTLFVIIAPYMVASAVIASVFLGMFVDRELNQIDREQQWKTRAMTDPLTALPNRRAFERGMLGLRRPGEQSALLALDLDHFKFVNDTYGHAAGDYLLQQVAVVLRANMRQRDLLARVGGEELAVLLPATGAIRARQIANRLRREIAAIEIDWNGTMIKITVSIGVALADGALLSDKLFAQADAALYAAKRGGRDCVVFSGEMLLQPAPDAIEVTDRPTMPHRVA